MEKISTTKNKLNYLYSDTFHKMHKNVTSFYHFIFESIWMEITEMLLNRFINLIRLDVTNLK